MNSHGSAEAICYDCCDTVGARGHEAAARSRSSAKATECRTCCRGEAPVEADDALSPQRYLLRWGASNHRFTPEERAKGCTHRGP